MLESLGLDNVAQAVYTEMLRAPESGILDLAGQTGRSESEVRDALDRLVEMMLLRPSREEHGRLAPVSPLIGIRRLASKRENELSASIRAVEESAEAVRATVYQAMSDAGGPAVADTEHLTNLDAVQLRLDVMVAGAKAEVMSLIPGGAVPAASLEAARPADALALGRGVRNRIVYQEAVRNDAATFAYGIWLAELGAEVRTTPLLPQRLLIVDGQAAALPLDPASPWAGRVYTTNPGLVAQLTALFEQIWEQSEHLTAAATASPDSELTRMEETLLSLLAAGCTDETAAKRLGLSGRTVRRMVADLMRRLGAASRFEAGLRAKERGWL